MGLIDFDKLAKQYATQEDDFGFSAVSEEDYNSVINKTTETADDYKARLQELEKIIIPFLTKLHSTHEKAYIFWPDRKKPLEDVIEKILNLTKI